MKILVLGGTGGFGSRSIASLLLHGHQVVAFVRSSKKLIELFNEDILKKIQIFEGDAENEADVVRALEAFKCDGLINCAGAPSKPGGPPTSRQGYIGVAVANAALTVSRKRTVPLRAWFVIGLVALDKPGYPGRILYDE